MQDFQSSSVTFFLLSTINDSRGEKYTKNWGFGAHILHKDKILASLLMQGKGTVVWSLWEKRWTLASLCCRDFYFWLCLEFIRKHHLAWGNIEEIMLTRRMGLALHWLWLNWNALERNKSLGKACSLTAITTTKKDKNILEDLKLPCLSSEYMNRNI